MAAPLCRHLTHYKCLVLVPVIAVPPRCILLLKARFILNVLHFAIKMQAHLPDMVGIDDQFAAIPPAQLLARVLVGQVIELPDYHKGLIIQHRAEIGKRLRLMIPRDLMDQIG